MAVKVLAIFNRCIQKYSTKAFERLSRTQTFLQEEQLYHYTSLAALEKIITTKTLQATSLYMMNDPNELVFGYEQLAKHFSSIIAQEVLGNTRYKTIYGYPAFAFCLTELNDDMYYWDKYGDRHKGIRIGFTPKNLIEYWREIPSIDALLVPVVYQQGDGMLVGEYSNDYSDFRTEFLNEILQYSSNHKMNDHEKDDLQYCLALISSMVKKAEWAIEKEWRIICIANGHLHENIRGTLQYGRPLAKLNNTTDQTLAILTNRGHDGLASKDVLKIGSLAGNLDYVEYAITLLFRESTNMNYFDERISQSTIQTR